jgi:uncharacterized lipoprotein YddW (UPF0748 family)
LKNLFKFLLILLAIILVLAFALNHIIQEKLGVVYDVTEIRLNGTNSPRYEDHLILYTTEFDRNEYGYEILVESKTGFVIEKDDIVTLREGTYILSGYGEAADFLMNINIGDIVEIDLDLIKIKRHLLKSNLKIIELEDQKINDIISYKTNNLYDINLDKIEELNKKIAEEKLFFKLQYVFSDVDENKAREACNKIIDLIDQKYYCTIESRTVELRGLWHRPDRSGIRENNLAGVREFVNHIHSLGINTLYVETFWHGMTTYYSDYLGLAHPQMAKYSYGEYGNDYMLALISECHKLGIEVHAWFEALKVNVPYGEVNDYIDPEWIVYNLDGDESEGFMDPSNPDVQEFLLNIISEMLQKYEFDGISYDYIRYSESGEFDGYKDSGFSENSISLFSNRYKYQGSDLLADVANNESIRLQWHQFKNESITSLVKAMTKCVREINPEIIISTSPYGHVEHAKTVYMQDVATWCEMGYIDVILPMIFTSDLEFYTETVVSFNNFSDKVLQIPGIYSLYNGQSLRETEELIDKIITLTKGNSIFASQNVISRKSEYTKAVLEVLSSTSHKHQAVSSTANAKDIFSAWKESLLEKCERLYQNRMTGDEHSLIENFCNKQRNMENPKNVAVFLNELIILKYNVQGFADSAVKGRIIEQIDYIYEILDLSITRYLISHGHWNPENQSERPDVDSLDLSQ